MLRTHGRSFVRSDNVKTVYPPTNKVCGGGGGGGGGGGAPLDSYENTGWKCHTPISRTKKIISNLNLNELLFLMQELLCAVQL